MISNDQLLALSAAGFIPAEMETDEQFLARVAFNKELKQHLSQMGPFENSPDVAEIKKKSCARAKELFGIDPAWVIIVLSSYKLPFWQAGVAWIFQLTETSPLGAFVQISSLHARGNGIFSYDPEEVITHEMAHIARMSFSEKKYEELIAYDASESGFRRFWGPLFRASWESALFLFMLVTLFIFDLFLLYFGDVGQVGAFLFLKLIPLVFLMVLAVRLISAQRSFLAALRHLLPLCENEAQARAIRLRLLDSEIDYCSKNSTEEIHQMLHDQREKSLRSRLLWLMLTNG